MSGSVISNNNNNSIPFHSIQGNPSISKKSLMVARPYPSKQTRKGAQSIMYIMEPMDHITKENTKKQKQGDTCINT
jgi:hypothetical protein